MSKQNLRFERRINKIGKTEIVEVYSIHSNDFLGVIHWKNSWRMYVMSYADNVDMSISCHDELNDYMKKLAGERNVKTNPK
jgi:hypothetical protein